MLAWMKTFQAYQHRPECFHDVPEAQWKNWIWQQQNAVRNRFGLKKIFPVMPDDVMKKAEAWEKSGFRFLITPYAAALVQKDAHGNPPADDPVWRQVFPCFAGKTGTGNGGEDGKAACKPDGGKVLASQTLFPKALSSFVPPDEYSKNAENWEIEDEMITPIAQHKYDNRVIIYTGDVCLGYCTYCFRSLQSNAEEEKHGGRPHWKATMDAIREREGVEEVILSGGDPLVFDNANVEAMLRDLREIPHVKALRIHTRAWLHNPYRIDEDFCGLLKKYEVTEMGVHTIHPREITKDFTEAVERIRTGGARTLLMADIPLVHGVNDDAAVLHELFMELYTSGVKPYYLSHNMPNIPFAGEQRTSVRAGLRLWNSLKRKISNPAMPEYIITHRTGKKTVPECEEGTPDFRYEKDQNGWPVVRFRDWKGEWREYIDAID